MEGALRDGHRLIETFGWTPAGGFARLDAHLARLAASAAALGVPLRRAAVEAALAGLALPRPDEADAGGGLRVRLLVDAAGRAAAETAPAPAPAPVAGWRVVVAAERLRSDDPWLRVKTTWRPAYDAARAALGPGEDEAILLNERGEVCDGTITSVFLHLGAGLLTPPLACGLLPGVLRGALLASGAAREAVLRPEDLRRGRLWVGNALRGLIPVRLG